MSTIHVGTCGCGASGVQLFRTGKCAHCYIAELEATVVPSESVALNPAILPALPGQKALTVTMLKDDGDVQADAAIEAIKAGTSTFHVTNPSRLFFHHLRLRVALEPALADKIAVYYLTDAEDPNKRWRLVGLGKDDQLRWPPNFELDLWEKEAQISAVGGHPAPGGRAEEIAIELRKKYGC
jgi:hypothetical protein